MRYRALGKTGPEVSEIGFGAASLGEEYGPIDPVEGERAVRYAIDQGINYFDVAPYYGGTLAETRLGQALVGRRHSIILATKVGRYKHRGGEEVDLSAIRLGPIGSDGVNVGLEHVVDESDLRFVGAFPNKTSRFRAMFEVSELFRNTEIAQSCNLLATVTWKHH